MLVLFVSFNSFRFLPSNSQMLVLKHFLGCCVPPGLCRGLDNSQGHAPGSLLKWPHQASTQLPLLPTDSGAQDPEVRAPLTATSSSLEG